MLKIYGSLLCPDCVRCCQELKEAQISFEYCDFGDSLLYLKEFLVLLFLELLKAFYIQGPLWPLKFHHLF